MAKPIAIVGSLDTKGEEFAFLKAEIEKRGLETFVIDTGVLGDPSFAPDITSAELAKAGGAELADLIAEGDRGKALDVMVAGAALVASQLYDEGKFEGIISMGGGGGTAVGTSAMRALPIGVPKLMVSTIASGDTAPYVGISDIIMMPAIVDVAGLNQISRMVFTTAAAAICAMVESVVEEPSDNKPLIAVSMFGNTTRAVGQAREILEEKGYEVLVFHATGTGGQTMEMLIESGYFAGVLDITTTELADEICGGVLSAGPERLDAAAKAGIPQVVTPACIDMCNFWAPETIPAKYEGRVFYHWNPNVTLMRTSPEENKQLGEIFAKKLNAATGPVALFVPMGGFSEVDFPGKPFWSPEANKAFLEAVQGNLRSDIPVFVMDIDVNHPEFSNKVTETLLEMLGQDKET